MRKFLVIVFVLLLVPLGYIVVTTYSHADMESLPPLESGDLIFQTNLTSQAPAIMFATHSSYTHVAIIHKGESGEYTVIEAANPVRESTLAKFIRSGWGERFTVLRYPGLSEPQRTAIVKDAETYIGKPYNFIFYLKSDGVYCSELPYLVFEKERLPLSSMQQMGELHMNNAPVHTLFESRWKMHPLCQKPGMDVDACWQALMKEPIITPAHLSQDPKLTTVYTNYLF